MSVNLIKQPAPSVDSTENTKTQTKTEQKKFNIPKVGVLTPPSISSTPMGDTLALKKQENPRMKYKLTTKKIDSSKFQNILSIGVIGCAIGALISLIKKH